MSIYAIEWAFKQQVERSSDKLLLVALANRAASDDTAWPSAASLHRDTQLDKKTIYGALKRLEQAGLIEDTGRRKGDTMSVIVWRLVGVPKRELEAQASALKNGSATKNGAAPFLPSSSPVFNRKRAQKRVTEPTSEPVNEPPPGGGGLSEDELEAHLQAARWAEEQAGRLCGPGFRDHVRDRLRERGPNARDIEQLAAWRAAQAAADPAQLAERRQRQRIGVLAADVRHWLALSQPGLALPAAVELEQLAPDHPILRQLRAAKE